MKNASTPKPRGLSAALRRIAALIAPSKYPDPAPEEPPRSSYLGSMRHWHEHMERTGRAHAEAADLDRFAAAALTGYLAQSVDGSLIYSDVTPAVAGYAYDAAETMLAERNRRHATRAAQITDSFKPITP